MTPYSLLEPDTSIACGPTMILCCLVFKKFTSRCSKVDGVMLVSTYSDWLLVAMALPAGKVPHRLLAANYRNSAGVARSVSCSHQARLNAHASVCSYSETIHNCQLVVLQQPETLNHF
jgi:hypothetical protein